MGCCYPKPDQGSDATPTTPLLNDQRSSSRIDNAQTATARRFKPDKYLTASSDGEPKILKTKSVQVAEVDKRLQDHMQLYNDHAKRWQNLKDAVQQIGQVFPEKGHKLTPAECFTHIRRNHPECQGIKIKRRFQYCMEMEYEAIDLDDAVITALVTFNRANKLIKEILDKGTLISSTILLVLEKEKDLRREVLVASLGSEGPDAMKSCIDNIAQLKKIPGYIETIKQETTRTFEELKNAAAILFQELEPEVV